MKTTPWVAVALLFLLAGPVGAQPEDAPPAPAAPTEAPSPPQPWKAPSPEPETAFDAAVWGMPIVSVHALREAFFRDAGATYGDIVYWSKPADWELQTPTPDPASRYVYFNFNSRDGPQVLEIPPAQGAALAGAVLDAWQRPQVEVGSAGEDAGAGGRYLLLPPDWPGPVPAAYRPVRLATYNGYALLRAIPDDVSDTAAQRAIALVKKLRLYPLSEAFNPPAQKHIDMAGRLFDGIVRFDENFYTALAAMLGEEPALPRDEIMLANLKTLGIIQGQPFKPGVATQQLLTAAAQEVQADFIRRAPAAGPRFYAGRQWRAPAAPGANADADEPDAAARGLASFLGYVPSKKAQAAPFYLVSHLDRAGQPLTGRRSYRLRVPANVPAAQFWSATVYAARTAAFIRNSPVISLDSRSPQLQRNGDGSVDLYFAPRAPEGWESNWIATFPGRTWFAIVRFHGPQPPLLDKSWTLPDIEEVK